MNNQEAIIVALCRCALFNATDATKHQIVRLKKSYLDGGSYEMVSAIDKLLNPEPNEMDGLKIVQSQSDAINTLIIRFKGYCSVSMADYRKWMQDRQFNNNVYEITDNLGKIRIDIQDEKATMEAWFVLTKLNSGEAAHVVYEIPNETYFELAKLYKGE